MLRLVEMGLDSTSIMRRVYYTLAELLLSEGKPGESAQYAERGLALFPDDEHLLFALASAKYVLEDFSAVNSALTQVINSPRSRHMYFGSVGDVRKKLAPRMLGAVQRMQKCYRSAEVTLEGVVCNYPGDGLAWYNLGLVYLDQGDGQKLARLFANWSACRAAMWRPGCWRPSGICGTTIQFMPGRLSISSLPRRRKCRDRECCGPNGSRGEQRR